MKLEDKSIPAFKNEKLSALFKHSMELSGLMLGGGGIVGVRKEGHEARASQAGGRWEHQHGQVQLEGCRSRVSGWMAPNSDL